MLVIGDLRRGVVRGRAPHVGPLQQGPLDRDPAIVHDDLDLPEETVRLKRGGGHGGHNGLRSLAESLGTGDFPRVRLGIGRPPGRQDPADYVLEQMSRPVAERLAGMVPHAAQAVVHVLEQGIDSAMREYNAG